MTAVVLFDLDDTLFAHRISSDVGIRGYLAELGEPFASADAVAAAALWTALEDEHYHSYLAGALDYLGQRRARAQAFCAAFGVNLAGADCAAWYDGYFGHYVANWVLHDDALECVQRLSGAGVRVGVITNGDLDYQQEKIAAVGLADLVEHVIASGEVGVPKPDPRIFQVACWRFGVAASDVAYVGDRLYTDAIGAGRAGLTGVWLNRSGRAMTNAESHDARAAAVAEIATLADLPALRALQVPRSSPA